MKRPLLIAGIALAVPAALLIILVVSVGTGCPPVAALRAYEPPEASHIYARDSSLIADLSPQRRTVVELEGVPAVVRDGFIAVEDRRFWSHRGVDLRGIARAAWRDLASLSFREGFSTISMQLARNVFPDELPRAKKLGRKFCEIRLARQMGREFSREEVLELYLNQIYLGDGRYGVEEAARGYFGKAIGRVDATEAALLVGLVQSPERYNPRKHPDRAIFRRNVVLDVMAREGVITSEEAESAKATPLRLTPPAEAAGSAPYVVSAVREELRERFGADADVRGLRVYTGIDPSLQRAARSALLAEIEKIENGAYGRYRHPRPEPGARAAGNSMVGSGTEASDPAAGGDAPANYLQGLVVALDPETGAIRALVGGRDFALSQFDRALQARRQPGSAFKPIVYAAALDRKIPITTRISTVPVAVETPGSADWRPSDHLPDSVETLPFRAALARSSNVAAVRVGQWVGPERVAELGKALGLSTPIPAYPSTYLGAAEVLPVELVAAYAAFGNGGYRVRPHLITRVEDDNGAILWEAPATHERVLDDGVAFLTLSMLRDVVDEGTGAAARRGGYYGPAAGKTGTTNEGKDAWFVGLTPDLVTGVWLGFDRPATIVQNAGGGALAAPVWGDLMARAYTGLEPDGYWTPPASLEQVAIDEASGFRATNNCPLEEVRIEYFLSGTEPNAYCPLHPESGVIRLLDRLWGRVRKIF
jgi:penicillin-binding protein 1A